MEEKAGKQFLITEEILATHRQRMLNYLIDSVVQIVWIFIALVFISIIAVITDNKDFIDRLATSKLAQYTLTLCIVLFYYNLFEILSARTIGKLITKTMVVDQYGEKPNQETILVRSLCRLIPFNVLSFIGFPARGWHDSISKTYVVNKKMLDEMKAEFYNPNKTKTEE
ncbi:RDD family protein [Flavobacterium terrisoli]|uniref:RDD family protein n=1 Tax=Flavobacterium terrisoli TaxID=3242195 RepID=UPI002542C5A8|nr:RDD family protein [Flavobacterium buctense]